MSQTFFVDSGRERHGSNGRAWRRVTNHLREDIAEGMEVYLEDRARAASVRRCGRVTREPFGKAWSAACASAKADGAYPSFMFLTSGFGPPTKVTLH